MKSSPEVRYCAMGERCTQYATLGEPQKLRRSAKSAICEPCQRAGLKPPRGSRGSIGDQTKALSLSAPDDSGCTMCGEPTLVKLFDNTDHSSVTNFCEECRGKLRAGKALASFVPSTEKPIPPEEKFEEVFRVARVLLTTGAAVANQVAPTLAFAAQTCEWPNLASLRDAFLETQEGGETWNGLSQRFSTEFRGLHPIRVVNRVLVLEQRPASVEVLKHPAAEEVVKEVKIEVYLRSAKPEEIAELYGQALSRHDMSSDRSSQGAIRWNFSDGYLTVTVGSGDEITPEKARILSRRRRLPSFPPQQLIRDQYAALLGSVNKKKFRGFAYALGGSPGPGAKAENLIRACTAWYAADRGWMIENPQMRSEVARLLNRHLLIPCRRTPLPEDGWSSEDPVWRDAKKMSQYLGRIEYVLQNRIA
jgi:hypothetical protein